MSQVVAGTTKRTLIESTHKRGLPLVYQAGTSGACVHLMVLGADNIHAADLMGYSDPYCSVNYREKVVGTTRVKTMTLHPEWHNETFVLPMSKKWVNAHERGEQLDDEHAQMPVLKVDVYDYDAM